MSNQDYSYDENNRNTMKDQSAMTDDERNSAQTMPTRTDQVNVPVTGESNQNQLGWIRGEDINDLKNRWRDIQAKFVDEPRASVEQADALVADTLVRLEKSFSNHRASLADNKDISTEELRVALQSYRNFLNKLLTF